MRSIRSLSLGRLSSTHLAPEVFTEFGVELEDLKLTHSSIDTIKAHAFKNVRGLKRLDLSENRISQIENEAFTEVIWPNDILWIFMDSILCIEFNLKYRLDIH